MCSTGSRRAIGGPPARDSAESRVRLGVAISASGFMNLAVQCAVRSGTARGEYGALAILAEVGGGRKRVAGTSGRRTWHEKRKSSCALRTWPDFAGCWRTLAREASHAAADASMNETFFSIRPRSD